MFTTKITRLGNSKGIILPAKIIKALSLDEGDSVKLIYHQKTQTFTISFPKTKQLKLRV